MRGGWKKEVRWLLTNRKYGGKTKSVSVLKAALERKNTKRKDGKKDKMIVNDRKRKNRRNPLLRMKNHKLFTGTL